MALIQWRKEFETGNASVDFEHQEMVKLLNDLYDSLGDGDDADIGAVLGEVYAKISAHFALEETLMRKAGYPALDEHKNDHERLLDSILDIMDAYDNGDYRNQLDVFADSVKHWFVDHFATHDARLHHNLGHLDI